MKLRFTSLALLCAACQPPPASTSTPPQQAAAEKPVTAADATAFVKRVNDDLKQLYHTHAA